MIRVLPYLPLLLIAGVCTDAREEPELPEDGRQVVRFELETGGAQVGDPRADRVIVEFGSFACGTCRRLHRNTLVTLTEVFARGGVQYRYFDLSPDGGYRLAARLARCLAREMGFLDARSAVYSAMEASRDSASFLRAVSESSESPQELLRCSGDSALLDSLGSERLVASGLGVRATPTLIIGRRKGGRVAGWPFLGAIARSVVLERLGRIE